VKAPLWCRARRRSNGRRARRGGDSHPTNSTARDRGIIAIRSEGDCNDGLGQRGARLLHLREIEPGKHGHGPAEGAVDLVVAVEVGDVDGEADRSQQPQDGRDDDVAHVASPRPRAKGAPHTATAPAPTAPVRQLRDRRAVAPDPGSFGSDLQFRRARSAHAHSPHQRQQRRGVMGILWGASTPVVGDQSCWHPLSVLHVS
jgi:hypothetical protein